MSENGELEDLDDLDSGPPRKKRIHGFDDCWLAETDFKDWLIKRSDIEAECRICRRTIYVKHEGRRALLLHAASTNHVSAATAEKKLQNKADPYSTSQVSSKPSTTCKPTLKDDGIVAAQVTSIYHAVKHRFRYDSQDCYRRHDDCTRLTCVARRTWTSEKTKTFGIIQHVLAPSAHESLLADMKSAKYFSIGIDSSYQGGSLKMHPVTVQYFSEEGGIKTGLLGFYEDGRTAHQKPNEAEVEGIKKQIVAILHNNNLAVSDVSAVSADNLFLGFGKSHCVREKLKAENPGIVRATYVHHILHNCTRFPMKYCFVFDFEILALKVFGDCCTYPIRYRPVKLQSIYEFAKDEYGEILRSSSTGQWLSFLPALECLLDNWTALRTQFIPKLLDEDGVPKIIMDAFSDKENDSLPLCYGYFLRYIMKLFRDTIERLENDDFTSCELHQLMVALRQRIIDRKTHKFYGWASKNVLRTMNRWKAQKFTRQADLFYLNCIRYLDKGYDFDTSDYKDMAIISLQQPFSWHQLVKLVEKHHLQCVDIDKLYEDYCVLGGLSYHLKSFSEKVDRKWMEYFRLAKKRDRGIEMKKLVSFVLSIPVSNVTCEITTSVMDNLWEKDGSKHHLCGTCRNVFKAKLQIMENFHFSCNDFRAFVLQSPGILAAARSHRK